MTVRRFVAASLLAATALVAATPASAQRVDRIVAFGESYADTGIGRSTILADPLANPTFQGQVALFYPTGRFSGGTNYIDTLAQLLGAPVENFAVGGALARTFPGGSDNTNCTPAFGGQPSPATCPLGLSYEVDQFLNTGVQSPLFPTGTPSFNANDLVTVSAGGNDARFFQVTGGTLAGVTAGAALSVTGATTQLNRLVAAGAPTISFLAGDTSRLPEVIGNSSAQAIRAAYSTAFNTGIQSTLAGYAANGVTVHYLDLSKVLGNVAANPIAYGITKGSAASAFTCPIPTPSAPGCLIDSTGYLFYFDGLHLTSDGFRIVGKYVAAQLEAPLTLQATSDLALDTARQFGRTMTTRMDAGSPRDGELLSGVRLFAMGDTFSRTADATFTSDQIKTTSVGATVGLEAGFSGGTAGIAANYSKPKAKVGAGVADTRSRSYQIGAFAGFGLAGGFAQGYLGYGKDKHRINRMGVIDAMSANPSGSHVLAGAKAGYLMPLGGLRAGPVIALDYAKAKVNGYTETGDAALTLNVNSQRFSSLRGSAGLELRGDMDLGGMHFRPFAALLAEKDFKGDGRTVYYAQTSAPTIVNHFAFENASKKTYGRVNLGFGAGISSALSVDAGVSGTFGKKQGNETSGQLGFNLGF